ncbi:hypothetical protein DPEC_G00084790 [Dallia pectoralis]|uniref:Uncharacterized protein n=1 Tax=Dallia pectoralis TaxID=75939 RepID=A0ACC2GZJ8_DALPE|nr:hypothetical protein DPEC_G00084790 [Dallia pectoralis]
MYKSWDSRTVIMEMKEAFKEKIPMDSRIELLMACGTKLVAPKLHSGQELSGLIIHKIFKSKAIYVRPSNDLPCKVSIILPQNYLCQSCEFSYSWKEQQKPKCIYQAVSQSPLVSDNYDRYLSIMGALPDLSSDEEVNEAILASLESHPTSEHDTPAQESKRDPCNLGVSWRLRREQMQFHPWASPHNLQWISSMSCHSDKHIPGNPGVLHAMITTYSQGKAKMLDPYTKQFQYT